MFKFFLFNLSFIFPFVLSSQHSRKLQIPLQLSDGTTVFHSRTTPRRPYQHSPVENSTGTMPDLHNVSNTHLWSALALNNIAYTHLGHMGEFNI